MSTPKHSVSVAGIVVNEDGRVLLIQRRDNRHWEPPGGVLELSEAFEDGVRREVYEETGVAVTVDRLTGVYKNMERGIVALVFYCRGGNKPAPVTSEAVQVQWMTVEQARAVMAPAYHVRITDALTPGVNVRVHDGINVLGA
ncbi:NUDIX hydrolase [Actinokineospora guangxiensis]|uniref:NUDIX hydrolase n=1 Tax=Actinokineospora guangxiensis TaxID=1490288 RepID=A0ABW0EWY5_9PSEU